MEDIKLINVKELAKRWGKDEGTIRRYIADKIITPCVGVPGTLFHPEYIFKLEGVELEKFSPLEKRRLERELERVKISNEKLKCVLANILSESAKVINLG